MRSHSATLALVIAVSFLIIACKNDETTGPSEAAALPLFTATLLNPITSTATEAVTSTSYITTAAGYARAAWLDAFGGVTSSVNNDTTRWTLTVGTLTRTLWSKTINDSTIAWGLVYNGSDSAGSYTNWTRMGGTCASKRTSEFWYDYGTPVTQKRISITITKSSSAVTVTVTTYSLLGLPLNSFGVTSNSDGSGTIGVNLDLNNPGSPYYHAIWLANGSGMWQRGNRDGITGGGMW